MPAIAKKKIKSCKNCGAKTSYRISYLNKGKGRGTFCSLKCLYSYKLIPIKKCATCGVKFKPFRNTGRFCSKKCYGEFRGEKWDGDKTKVWRIFNLAVNFGEIKRKPCEICGKKNAQGHHPNYNEPLKVIWLCPKHHRELHEKNKRR